jgi:hypothetical protein
MSFFLRCRHEQIIEGLKNLNSRTYLLERNIVEPAQATQKADRAGVERPVWRAPYLTSAKQKICLKHCVALNMYCIHTVCLHYLPHLPVVFVLRHWYRGNKINNLRSFANIEAMEVVGPKVKYNREGIPAKKSWLKNSCDLWKKRMCV